MASTDWFETRQVKDHLYLTTERHFGCEYHCNIWLIKGSKCDVIIDTGLGVHNLRQHLEEQGLIDPPGHASREVIAIITHVHYDHSGGARHFQKVLIHPGDMNGLQNGSQSQTLNFVKPHHFHQAPYQGFSAFKYKVPGTQCIPIHPGETIDLGGSEELEIMHFPGHTAGSIAIYNPHRQELFTGDIVYESQSASSGKELLDWLPTSNVCDYMNSAAQLLEWLRHHPSTLVYPGHNDIITAERTINILQEYIESRSNKCCACCATCCQCFTWFYIVLNCFRCCPC